MSSEGSLKFQVIDYYEDEYATEFVVFIFGKTKDEKSVCIKVSGYTPYFLIDVENLHKIRVWDSCYKSLNYVAKKKLIGFTNYELFYFVQFNFRNSYSRAQLIKRYKEVGVSMYDNDIPPLLKMVHERNLKSSGWIVIENKHLQNSERESLCDIEYKVDYKHLNPDVDDVSITKLKIAAFDIECVTSRNNGCFPDPSLPGDPVIQIAITYSYYGEDSCHKRVLLCLKETGKIDGVEVLWFDTEKELLIAFTEEILKGDPDIITGWNINGFDFKYIFKRSELLEIENKVRCLSKIKNHLCDFKTSKFESAAAGSNEFFHYHIPGRVVADMIKFVKSSQSLESYALDYVSSLMLRDKIVKYEPLRETFGSSLPPRNFSEDGYILIENFTSYENLYEFTAAGIYGMKIAAFITLFRNDGISDEPVVKQKFQILGMNLKTKKFIVQMKKDFLAQFANTKGIFWCQAKNDVDAANLWVDFNKSIESRTNVGRYCDQDSCLCNLLMAKLNTINFAIGMSSAGYVPLSFIFFRGQGIKVLSLVSKECTDQNFVILGKKEKKVLQKSDSDSDFSEEEEGNEEKDPDEEGYPGALVLEVDRQIQEEPVMTLDFNSLYPKIIISLGLSHDTLVIDKKYMNLPNVEYFYVEDNCKEYKKKKEKQMVFKIKDDKYVVALKGETAEVPRRYMFARVKNVVGVIPTIVDKLLNYREHYKKLQSEYKIKDKFLSEVYDSIQLAYKVFANSIYGILGTPSSPLYRREIAASVTAHGRQSLTKAIEFAIGPYSELLVTTQKNGVEGGIKYAEKIKLSHPKLIPHLKTISRIFKKYETPKVEVIYGDTDSIFFKANLKWNSEYSKYVKGNEENSQIIIRDNAIKIGMIASDFFCTTLKSPMKMAFEKILHPFVITHKKKYSGYLYTDDPTSGYLKTMGMVNKRRDIAPIGRDANKLLLTLVLKNAGNKKFILNEMIDFLEKMVNDKHDVYKYAVSKRLKPLDAYANWTRISHAVLAKRAMERDPGSAPKPGDRMLFVHFYKDYLSSKQEKTDKQGDKIELLSEFEKPNSKLKVDIGYYIDTQIRTPCCDILEIFFSKEELNKIFDSAINVLATKRKKKGSFAYLYDKALETKNSSG